MTEKDLVKSAMGYFAQIRKTDRLIQRLKDTVKTLRFSLTSQNYEVKHDKVHTSGSKDTLSETVVKIVSLEDDINARIDELVDMKKEAFNMIGRIPDFDQQNVLIGRYIQMKKWEDLAEEFEYTTQWLFEIHGKALQAFCEVNSDFLKVYYGLLKV